MYLNQSDRTRKGAHYDYGDPGNQSPPSRCFPTTQKKSFWCCHSYHQSASQYQLKTRIIRNDCEMWYKMKQTTFLFRVPFNWLSNQHFSKRNHCEQAPLYPKCIWNVFFQWQIYSVWISTVMAIWCVCVWPTMHMNLWKSTDNVSDFMQQLYNSSAVGNWQQRPIYKDKITKQLSK